MEQRICDLETQNGYKEQRILWLEEEMDAAERKLSELEFHDH